MIGTKPANGTPYSNGSMKLVKFSNGNGNGNGHAYANGHNLSLNGHGHAHSGNGDRYTNGNTLNDPHLNNLYMDDDFEEPETYVFKDGGVRVIDRFFEVPLDYSDTKSPVIRIFARNLIPLDLKGKTEEETRDLPYFVYLQGGPGFEVDIFEMMGLAKEIHERGYQTLWLDQRGTGLSTPICPDIFAAKTDTEIAEYVKHFRADNIVRDCEMIRWILLGDRISPDERKWTIMGQSFGGFCCITYLSFYPSGLKEVFLAGGLAPLVYNPDPAHRRLFPRVIKRNKAYYKKYPKDIKRVRTIANYLEEFEIILPNGGNLTPKRLQHLGIDFGFSGGIDRVHQLILRAANDLKVFGQLSYKLLQSIQNATALDGNPLYMLLQETLYCNGRSSNWSAERLLSEYQEFDWDIVKLKSDSEPLYFLGEVVLRQNFDDYAGLRTFKGAAEILAQKSDWPSLFNLNQLEKNEVPASAMTYVDDIYVDYDLAQDTAERIQNVEQCITNQLFHNAVLYDPKTLMNNLFEISKRRAD